MDRSGSEHIPEALIHIPNFLVLSYVYLTIDRLGQPNLFKPYFVLPLLFL